MKTVILILSAVIGTSTGFAPVQTTTRKPTSLAFFGNAAKSKESPVKKSSPQADEAVELYSDKYLKKADRKQLFFETWGMPGSYRAPDDSSRKIFSRETDELMAAFNAIASIYGDEEALKMVKIQPGCLAFNKDNFQLSLDAFGENFGYEESKAMIIRNPGLLSCKPANAETADDLTMQLSYVVEFTRPIGNFGPALIVALLSVPALENFFGVTRGELLSNLF